MKKLMTCVACLIIAPALCVTVPVRCIKEKREKATQTEQPADA